MKNSIIICFLLFLFTSYSHALDFWYAGMLPFETTQYVQAAFNPIYYAILFIGVMIYGKKYFEKNKSLKSRYNMKYLTATLIAVLASIYVMDYYLFFDKKVTTHHNPIIWKPVIYLYPEQTSEIYVGLDFDWELIADYPAYDNSIWGWGVVSTPESKVTDLRDGKEYSYIFWEWIPSEPVDWDLSTWFVVPGSEVREFLQDILPKMWLTPREYNEFVVYWYPLLQNNPYNLIHFAEEQYTDTAPLTTVPEYDSLLRVFMVAKALNTPVDVEPQSFEDFERKGFTVVEWGWTILNQDIFK